MHLDYTWVTPLSLSSLLEAPGLRECRYFWQTLKDSHSASSQVLKLIGARLPLPVGLTQNRRRFIIHCLHCASMLNVHRRSAAALGPAKHEKTWENLRKPESTWENQGTLDSVTFAESLDPFMAWRVILACKLHRASQRASLSTLKVWSIPQHHWSGEIWFACQHSMISPVLHQIFSHCRTSTLSHFNNYLSLCLHSTTDSIQL